jgi:hypothetical protein
MITVFRHYLPDESMFCVVVASRDRGLFGTPWIDSEGDAETVAAFEEIARRWANEHYPGWRGADEQKSGVGAS